MCHTHILKRLSGVSVAASVCLLPQLALCLCPLCSITCCAVPLLYFPPPSLLSSPPSLPPSHPLPFSPSPPSHLIHLSPSSLSPSPPSFPPFLPLSLPSALSFLLSPSLPLPLWICISFFRFFLFRFGFYKLGNVQLFNNNDFEQVINYFAQACTCEGDKSVSNKI